MASRIQKLQPKHYDLIELLVANPKMTHKEMAEHLNCDYRNVNRIIHAPVFKEALQERLKEEFKSAQKIAVNTMVKLAEEGNFQAAKYILDNTGYELDKNININGNIKEEIVINIIGCEEDEN